MSRILAIALVCLAVLPAQADDRVIQFLEDRYTHAFLQHVGDAAEETPEALGRADCTDVRALGRSESNRARQLGRTFERAGVHINLIASSRWCAALATAQLLELRPVTEEPLLNLFATDDVRDSVDAILALIDGQRPSDSALLVTHGPVIEAVIGRRTQPGEVVVFRLRPGADIEIRGSFVPD